MKRWEQDRFLEELATKLGVDEAHAESVARAVVAALGDVLEPAAARHVAATLPQELAGDLTPQRVQIGERIVQRSAFLRRLAGASRDRASHAWEDAVAVGDLVRDGLGDELAFVRGSLSPELAELFADRDVAPPMSRAAPLPRVSDEVPAGQTLSGGKPGPRNPIAESPAGARGPAQRGSVAASDPHGERKLSSATRDGETLASGRR